MDLKFTREEETFRQHVRDFLTTNLPARLSNKVRLSRRLTKGDLEEWHGILHSRGWLGSHWPVEWGGPGWSVTERFIFELELARAYAPRIVPFGVNMLAPVLIRYGTEAQRRHWLPRILDGSDWWCQGYSEPGAGSDLASLKCLARRDGDHYIIDGQKTWATLAQYADMIFCLVRTDPNARKKQDGISFLLVDMKTPGVEVRPIMLLDGEPEVNEVFFTNVRVPIANLVGQENEGWTYAKYLLTYERTNLAGVGGSIAALAWLKHIAQNQKKGGLALAEDPYFAARLAKVEIELENMTTTNLRLLAGAAHGSAPAAESSMLKIRGTEIRQEITSLARRAVGPYAQPSVSESQEEVYDGDAHYAAGLTASYLNNRKLSIFGGSNEIQREIIAKSILEL